MPRLRTTLLAFALTVATGCSSDAGEAEVAPDEAVTRLRAALTELLAAAAPEVDDGLSDVVEVPCGGLGGNEWSKVRYTLETIDGVVVDDSYAAALAARDRAEDLGYDTTFRTTEVGFDDGVVSGTVFAREAGVLIAAETPCLDNPGR